MTDKQQQYLINLGIEVGLTLAGVALAAGHQYLREHHPEATSITNGLKTIYNGAKAMLDLTAIEIEDIKK